MLAVVETIIQTNLPAWVGGTIFALLFGTIMYFGCHSLIDKFNSGLVFVVIAFFAGLLLLTDGQVQIEQLVFQDWTQLTAAILVMLAALFYHNVISVIGTQLEGDAKKIKQSFFWFFDSVVHVYRMECSDFR